MMRNGARPGCDRTKWRMGRMKEVREIKNGTTPPPSSNANECAPVTSYDRSESRFFCAIGSIPHRSMRRFHEENCFTPFWHLIGRIRHMGSAVFHVAARRRDLD